MRIHQLAVGCFMLLATGLMATDAVAQNSRVSYGRITAVNRVNLENEGARSAGAVVGGLAGLATGSGQSRSNRALRSMGGAAVGGRVAGAASTTTGFEYTVLVGARTVRVVTEKSGCGSATASPWSAASSTTSAWPPTIAAMLLARPPCLRRMPARPMRAPPPRSRCWTRIRTRSSIAPSDACGCCADEIGVRRSRSSIVGA